MQAPPMMQAQGGGSSERVEQPPQPIPNPTGGEVAPVQENVSWTHESGATLKIQNVTVTANFGIRLVLKDIVCAARNAEYNPKRFAACVMRCLDPKCTALIFSSGKMIVTGARSVEQGHTGARKFQRILHKVGFPLARLRDFTTQNVVATCDVGFPIRLEGLVDGHSKFATYEPELFPGLIYRLSSPKVVLLIFVSGKVVMTGGKSFESLQEAFTKMYPVLVQYQKRTTLVAVPTGQAPQGTT